MFAYPRRELLGLLGSASAAALAAGRPQPNILYMMADYHPAHAISAYGSRINQPPNIYPIATRAARVNNCYSTTSNFPPARPPPLTAHYTHKNRDYALAAAP